MVNGVNRMLSWLSKKWALVVIIMLNVAVLGLAVLGVPSGTKISKTVMDLVLLDAFFLFGAWISASEKGK